MVSILRMSRLRKVRFTGLANRMIWLWPRGGQYFTWIFAKSVKWEIIVDLSLDLVVASITGISQSTLSCRYPDR